MHFEQKNLGRYKKQNNLGPDHLLTLSIYNQHYQKNQQAIAILDSHGHRKILHKVLDLL